VSDGRTLHPAAPLLTLLHVAEPEAIPAWKYSESINE
jgi:hypothetical protein